MNKEKATWILICFASILVFLMLFAPQMSKITQSFELSGTATVTVLNSPPIVNEVTILDAGFHVSELFLEKEYVYALNISDSNTVRDIDSITLEIWTTNLTDLDGNCDYIFQYEKLNSNGHNSNDSFYQTLPENGDNLDAMNCSMNSYSQNVTGIWNLPITIHNTESCNFIFIKVITIDTSNDTAETIAGPFSIIKIHEGTDGAESHSIETPDEQGNNVGLEIMEKTIIGLLLIGAIGLILNYRAYPSLKKHS